MTRGKVESPASAESKSMISHDDYSRRYSKDFNNIQPRISSYSRNILKGNDPILEENSEFQSQLMTPEQQNLDKREFKPPDNLDKSDDSKSSITNDTYLKLLNDGRSQSFREKQRLSEDLERQKRLLMQDIARNEQLRVEQIRRKHEVKPATEWISNSHRDESKIAGLHQPAVSYYWSANDQKRISSNDYKNGNISPSYKLKPHSSAMHHDFNTYANLGGWDRKVYNSDQLTSRNDPNSLTNSRDYIVDHNHNKFALPHSKELSKMNKVHEAMSAARSLPGASLSSSPDEDHIKRLSRGGESLDEEKSAFRIVGNNPSPHRPGSLDLHRKRLQLDYKGSLDPDQTGKDSKHCIHSDDDHTINIDKQKSIGSEIIEVVETSQDTSCINGKQTVESMFTSDKLKNLERGLSITKSVDDIDMNQEEGRENENSNECTSVKSCSQTAKRKSDTDNEVFEEDSDSKMDSCLESKEHDTEDFVGQKRKEGLYVTSDLVLDLEDENSNKSSLYACSNFSNDEGDGLPSSNDNVPRGISELRIINVQSLRDKQYKLDNNNKLTDLNIGTKDIPRSNAISPTFIEENVSQPDTECKRKRSDNSSASSTNEQENVDFNHQSGGRRKSRSRSQKKWEEKEKDPTDFMTSQHRVAIDLPKHNWLVERLLSENRLHADALKSPPSSSKEVSDTIKDDSGKVVDGQPSRGNGNSMKSPSSEGETAAEVNSLSIRRISVRADDELLGETRKESNHDTMTKLSPEKASSIPQRVPNTSCVDESCSSTNNIDVSYKNSLVGKSTRSVENDSLNDSSDENESQTHRPENSFSTGENLRSTDCPESTKSRRLTRDDYGPKTPSDEKDFQSSNRVLSVSPKEPGYNSNIEDESQKVASHRKRESTSTFSSEIGKAIEPPPKLRRCSSDSHSVNSSKEELLMEIKKRNNSMESSNYSERIKIDLRSEQNELLKIDLSTDMKQNGGISIDYKSISDYATRMVDAELKGNSDKLPPPPTFISRSLHETSRTSIAAYCSREPLVPSAGALTALPRPSQNHLAVNSMVLANSNLLRPDSRHSIGSPIMSKPSPQQSIAGNNMSRFFHHHHHHHVHQHQGACNHLKKNGEQSSGNTHWDANCPHYGVTPGVGDQKGSSCSPLKLPTASQASPIKDRHQLPPHVHRNNGFLGEKTAFHPDIVRDHRVELPESPASVQNMPKRPVPTHPDFAHRFSPRDTAAAQMQLNKGIGQYPRLMNPHNHGIMRPPMSGTGEDFHLMRARRGMEIQRELYRKDFAPRFNEQGPRKYPTGSFTDRNSLSDPFSSHDKANPQESRESGDFGPRDSLPPFGSHTGQETNAMREANKALREANAMREVNAMEEAAMLRRRMASMRHAETFKEEALMREKAMHLGMTERSGVNSEEFERLRAYKQMKEHELLMKASDSLVPLNSRAILPPHVVDSRGVMPQNTLPGAIHRSDEMNLRERMLQYNIEQAEKIRLHAHSTQASMSHEVHKVIPEYPPDRKNNHYNSRQEMINASRWNEVRHLESKHGTIQLEAFGESHVLRTSQYGQDKNPNIERPLPRPDSYFSKPSTKSDPRTAFREVSKDHQDHSNHFTQAQSVNGKAITKAEPLAHAIDLSKHPTLSKTLDQISKQASYPAANGLMNLAMLARQGGNDQVQTGLGQGRHLSIGDMPRDQRRRMSPHFFNGGGAHTVESGTEYPGSRLPGSRFLQERNPEISDTDKVQNSLSTEQSTYPKSINRQKTPPSTRYFSGELFKMLSEERKTGSMVKKTESKPTDVNIYQVQANARNSESMDRDGPTRLCKICNKDAQFLCSGCRGAWYCSHECQIKEWKEHSKICKKAAH